MRQYFNLFEKQLLQFCPPQVLAEVYHEHEKRDNTIAIQEKEQQESVEKLEVLYIIVAKLC